MKVREFIGPLLSGCLYPDAATAASPETLAHLYQTVRRLLTEYRCTHFTCCFEWV